jgi:DNA repair protein RadC
MTQQLALFGQPAQTISSKEKRESAAVEKRARQLLREWMDEYQPKVSDMPEKEQPVNRCADFGPGALSTAELIAVILGGAYQLQQAASLLAKYDGLLGLARAPHHDLEVNGGNGIGKARAARIKAALELGRRLMIASPEEKPQVKSPADAANLLMGEMMSLDQEHLKVILLDSKNRVQKVVTVYVGSLNTSVVRVGEIFREAIRMNVAAIIVAHNHPSGDPTPSPEDVHVTEAIVQAGELVDIQVLDHVIIGQQRYVSLKERGLGF